MKQLLIFIFCLAGLLPQVAQGQFVIRPQVGAGVATQAVTYYDQSIGSVRPSLVFEAGATVAYPLQAQLSLYSGLMFQSRGSREVLESKGATSYSKETWKVALRYLELPIGLSYKPLATQELWLDVGLGFAMAMSGRRKKTFVYKDDYMDEEQRDVNVESIRLGDRGEEILRGDVRLNLGARMKLPAMPVEVGARASLGLTNVAYHADHLRRNYALVFFAAVPIDL